MLGQKQARGLAQTPFGPVSLHGAPDFAAGGEARAHAGVFALGALGPRQGLHQNRAARAGAAARGRQELGATRQALYGGRV